MSYTRGEGDQGNQHFFEGDAAVLEGVGVILHVVVVVVGVGEEVVVACEYIGGGYVGCREAKRRRILDFIDLPLAVGQVFPHFIA